MLDKSHGFLTEKSPSQDCLLAAEADEDYDDDDEDDDDDDDDDDEREEKEKKKVDEEEVEEGYQERVRWERAIGQSFTNRGFEDLDGIRSFYIYANIVYM